MAKLLYLTSARYSGSTLFSLLLGSQEGISTIGERRKFYSKVVEPAGPAVYCSCGRRFVDCPHWQALLERYLALRGGGAGPVPREFTYFRSHANDKGWAVYNRLMTEAISRGIPPGYLPQSGRLRRLLRENELLIKASLELDGNEVFFDSSKPVEHGVFFSTSTELDVYNLWLIRDPRAQAVSALKYNDWTLAEAARRWIKVHERARRNLGRGNIPVLKVSYERFCREPGVVLEEINSFADLRVEEWNMDFREQEMHVMGNYGTRRGKSSVISERLEWVEKISIAERRQLEGMLAGYTEYFSPSVPVA